MLDVVGLVAFELACTLEACFLAECPDFDHQLGGNEHRPCRIPGESSGALLMALVALVLEGLEEIVVFDVDAVLILQSHLDNYNL